MKKNTLSSCKQCGKDFRVKRLLHDHERNCILPNFNCDICSEQFSDHVLLAKHILTHIGAMPYFCSVCKTSFISKRQLQLHLLTHEKSSKREVVNLKLLNGNLHECNRCICKFSSWPKLAFHYVCHIKEMHYTCDICNTSFFNKKNFLIHSHLHKPNGAMKCDICNETFEIKSICLLHVISHSKFEWFRYFPSCESAEDAVSFNNSVSSGNNNDNILSISASNSVNVSAECQTSKEVTRIILDDRDTTTSQTSMKEEYDPVQPEYSGELHIENNNQCESPVKLENSDRLDLDNDCQNLKTEPCESTEFDGDNSVNEGFVSDDSDITCKLEDNKVKELSVVLHRLPDCVYNAYSYHEYSKVRKLKLVKTKNYWFSSTVSNETCLADDFPHVCSETIHALSASELEGNMCHEVGEENNSYQNFNLKECRVVLTDIAVNNVSNSFFASLPLEELSDDETRRASSIKYHVTENFGSSDQQEVLSSSIKSYDKDLANDNLKSEPLQSETSTDNLLPKDKFNPSSCLNEASENNLSMQMKKLYVKIHKLPDSVLNLYLNNQPIILRKNAVLGNLNTLGDCNNIVEYNSILNASNIENDYFESDNFNNQKACLISNISTTVESNASCRYDDRIREDRHTKKLDKHQSKGFKKKKKENTISFTCSIRNEIKFKKISKEQQLKKIRKKKRLRKKRILFKKYIKSLLLNSCMDSKFLLTLKYSQLARTVKELEKRCKENNVDENYFSFVEGLINSAFLSKKKIKKRFKSSRFTQSYKKCTSERRKNVHADNAAVENISSNISSTADNNSGLKNKSEMNDHNYHAVYEETMPMKISPFGYLDNKVMKNEKKKKIKKGVEIENKRAKIHGEKKGISCTHGNKMMTLHSKLEKFSFPESQKMKKNVLKNKGDCDCTVIASKIINTSVKENGSSTSTNSKIIENVSNEEFTYNVSEDEIVPSDVITNCANHRQVNEANRNGIQEKYYMRHNLADDERIKNQETSTFSDFDNKIEKNICKNAVLDVSNSTDSTHTVASFMKYAKNVLRVKLTERSIVNKIAKASLKRSKYRINAKDKNISKMKVSNHVNVANKVKKIISESKKVSRAVQVTEKRKNNSFGSQNIDFYSSSTRNNKRKHNVFQVKKVNYSGINNKNKKSLLSKNKNSLLKKKSEKNLSHEKNNHQLNMMPIINSVPPSDHVAFVIGKSPMNVPAKPECEITQNSDNNQEIKSIYIPTIIRNSSFSVTQSDQNGCPGINSIQNLHSPTQTMNLKVTSPAAVINQNCSETTTPLLLKYNAVQSLPTVNVSLPSKTNDDNLAYVDNSSRFVPALSLVENPLYSQNTDTCSSVEQGEILIQNTNVQGMPVIESVGHLVILNGAKISSFVPRFHNGC